MALQANHWEPDSPHIPGWAQALLDIDGVEEVTDLFDRPELAVDTTIYFDEDGFAEPKPELMEELGSMDEWNIHQVKFREVKYGTIMRVELTPTENQVMARAYKDDKLAAELYEEEARNRLYSDGYEIEMVN